jgi:hypothetical protein
VQEAFKRLVTKRTHLQGDEFVIETLYLGLVLSGLI